eukprot:CAMPEP_0204077602 /NCGR_PEP_ID=MMETSP0360-20130528/169600_1 /ASSEMBLY_ACC=CAM_ASM_000342 /TAXON_ID=268821 /ORGANISM="Scrippsiella Hangoei, Strain SHTV-5" /LENGTH=68 /DNA_ID=CAMNT_0051026231 /DNA_START=79 /DNA_END=283 /DNA_ORIENTATION=+
MAEECPASIACPQEHLPPSALAQDDARNLEDGIAARGGHDVRVGAPVFVDHAGIGLELQQHLDHCGAA